MEYIIIPIVVVAIVIVSQIIRNKKPDNMMKQAASIAVSTAKQCYQIELDYSDSSIEKTEKVLGRIHEDYLKSKSEEGIHGLSIMYGAYLGEVLKKSKGIGRWEKDHPTFGKNSFPFYWNEKDCAFPVSWCFKRIANGPEENVVHKFKVFREGKKAT